MNHCRSIPAWAVILATTILTTLLSLGQASAQPGGRLTASGTATPTNNIAPPPGSRVAVAQLATPLPDGNLTSTAGRQPSVTNGLLASLPGGVATPTDTDQRIQPVDGGARWSFGLAKTAFSANLNAPSPVTITTPDRRELRCRPSFLAYYDTASGQCVLLGQAQSRVGAIVGRDKVIYLDAFKGIKADIRYDCGRWSLSQDVILRQRPADPATLGLNPQTTELQVWTEWIDSTPVATQARPLADGTVDEAVDFGTMKLVAGSAYASTNAADGTPVSKSWQSADGREFLVESVPVTRLAKFFNALPLTALFRPAHPAFSSKTEMAKAALPASIASPADKMELALAAPAADGVVLDFVIVASVPVPAGAISWWPAGGNAQDVLPAANHGSWAGTAAYGAGEVGQGFTFNGSNDVTVPDAASLNPTDGLTVETWIKENGAHYDHRDLVSKDGEGWDRQFILTISRDYGTFRAHVGTANGLFHVDGQTVVQPGTWYHVAMTYDAANSNLLLYVNGQLEASGLVPGGALITTTQPVRIGGGSPAGTQPYYFTGNIDEPTIYGRALGTAEIEAIYEAGGAGKDNPGCVTPPTGIVGWWPGDQNALDYAGTNNGTLNNSPGYAPAVAAQGFTFGGYNNVSIPDAPELNPTNGLTVEAWIAENGAHYDHRDLVSKDGEGYDRQFILTISRDYGTFRAHVSTASGPYNVDGQTVVQPGTWYHVAMTYDAASGSLLLYVNGELDASGTVPGGALITTTQPVRIGGGAPTGYLQYYFTGMIDEPALYNRALSAAEIGSLYAAGCAGKCKTDLDADGLPDAWENYWFGGYSHSGGDWDDYNQQTLQDDYNAQVDPNVITFSIESANDHVNTTTPTVQLNITSGTPGFYAVFVNSTNSANWLSFTGPSLNVPLGPTDGVYQIIVGLKGFPADATQTWQAYSFILDRTAPRLAIANPALVGGTATVIKPYLQLQGQADEPLASLSYSISNTFGLATNQDVFVSNQWFDTNRFDFTTNCFQAYDVPLATNDNFITLRVTDRAGNTTTTNFTVTLNYATATNPPVVTLTWPQDGMAVSGDTCTLRGTLDDETGTIQAQVINGDGTTNMIAGLVERNGTFWVENVPLNGTNQISVQAINAAGKMTTTNFIVYPSDIILTIDSTPTGDTLWQSSGPVSGTVSDPSATVTVNGTNAAVEASANGAGTYDWTAAGVPIYGQGTATFAALATRPGQPPVNALLAVEKEPHWCVADHFITETDDVGQATGDNWHNSWMKSYTASAQPDANGEWHETYNGWAIESELTVHHGWPYCSSVNYYWSNDWAGVALVVNDCASGNVETNALPGFLTAVPDVDSYEAAHVVGWWETTVGSLRHYYAAQSYTPTVNAWGTTGPQRVRVDANTYVKLYTGGKAQVARKNLFCLTVNTADEYYEPSQPNYGWPNLAAKDIPKSQLQVCGKQVGADGKLWIALPDNSEPNMTVYALGIKHYNADATPQKYKLAIKEENFNTVLDPDEVKLTNCVGQNVNFTLDWGPGQPPIVSSNNVQWTLGGSYVNTNLPQIYPDASIDYTNDPQWLRYEETHAWWYDGQYNPVQLTASFTEDLTFANGQTATVNASGLFAMHRPEIEDFETNGILGILGVQIIHGAERGTGELHTDPFATFQGFIKSQFDGDAAVTQLVNGYATNLTLGFNTSGKYELDNHRFIQNKHFSVSANSFIGDSFTFGDEPSITCSGNGIIMHDQFKAYVVFLPSGSDNIYVTLGMIQWHTYAETGLALESGQSQLDYTPFRPPAQGPADPGEAKWDTGLIDTDAFPTWENVVTNQEGQ